MEIVTSQKILGQAMHAFVYIPFYVSLWVVDGDEFLETQSMWVWIIHDMTCFR